MTESPKLWRNACWALIALAFLSVAITGLLDSEPMIGDEVTHYYMAVTQATVLPAPNVHAHIEMGNGTEEIRRYPQVFLWHYLAGIVCKYIGATFRIVECYQLLYVLQCFVVLWLLARHEEGGDTRGSFLFLFTVITLPLTLFFSVALYLDIPVLAQLLTSLWLLRKGRPLLSSLMFGIGLAIKVTLFPLVPVYLMLMGWQFYRSHGVGRAIRSVLASMVILVACAVPMVVGLKHEKVAYYPLDMAQQYVRTIRTAIGIPVPEPPVKKIKRKPGWVEDSEGEVMPTNPGDIRNPLNVLMFGGGALILLSGMVVAGMLVPGMRSASIKPVSRWALCLGVFFLAVTGLHLHAAPDIRFFLPGIVLVLLPIAQRAASLKGFKLWFPVLLVGGILQSGMVLHKAHMLRNVRPGIKEAITYLKNNSPGKGELFMYPEGNYRLFPIGHDWYMGFTLKEFWKSDNDARIKKLNKRGLSAIVIKKYLVGHLDPDMNNLGIYPDFFVDEIAADPRFTKLYENDDVLIYQVPGVPYQRGQNGWHTQIYKRGAKHHDADAEPTNQVPVP